MARCERSAGVAPVLISTARLALATKESEGGINRCFIALISAAFLRREARGSPFQAIGYSMYLFSLEKRHWILRKEASLLPVLGNCSTLKVQSK